MKGITENSLPVVLQSAAGVSEWLGLTSLWPDCSITWKTVGKSRNAEEERMASNSSSASD